MAIQSTFSVFSIWTGYGFDGMVTLSEGKRRSESRQSTLNVSVVVQRNAKTGFQAIGR
jgi:hypothetical protein